MAASIHRPRGASPRSTPPTRPPVAATGSSVEPRRPPRLGLTAEDLPGLVMGEPPAAVFANKKIAGRQRAAVKLLLAQHERAVAEQQHAFVVAGNARRVGIGQDAGPTGHHLLAPGQRRPTRM